MIEEAVKIISGAKHLVAFTGAGISAESGIPPYRGENGIWNKYDSNMFDAEYFSKEPAKCWNLIKKAFFEVIKQAKPNDAHYRLAELEKKGLLKSITTQNIDNLHFLAGSKNVIEFHGNTRESVCQNCGLVHSNEDLDFEQPIPRCSKCGGILKPDFVFFGDPIPIDAYERTDEEFRKTDVVILIGTSGVVYPAAQFPIDAAFRDAQIIEINTEKSLYTDYITTVFMQGKASEIMNKITKQLF